jgi:transposase
MTLTSTLFLGIDVSLDTNQACAMNYNQDKFFNLSFKNTIDGTQNLIDKIISTIHTNHLSHVVICMESTSLYFFHVANSLSMNEELDHHHCKVYCVNPKMIANYKKSFIDRPKNDPSDAWLIADFVRVGRCKTLHEWRGATFVAMQRLTRYRYHLAQNLSKEKNYCLNNIYLKFSQFRKKEGKKDTDNPFSDIFGATASAVLTDFITIDDIISMDIQELVNYINNKSKGRFADPDEVAKLLKVCVSQSYRLDKVSYDALNITISSNIRMIQMLEKELKSIDKQISDFAKGLHSNEMTILTSIKGVGPVFAAGIISEIGSIDCFKNDAALAKYAGFSWNDHSSGKVISENNELIASGNTYLKYYLQESCNLIRKYDANYAAFYSRKYNEAKTHKHKRALVLTTRKFVRMIYSMLRNNTLYANQETGEVTQLTE